MSRPVGAVVGIVASLAGATPRVAGAQALPVGLELQVNTYTSSSQAYPAVARSGDGSFVVVWQDVGYGDIFARRYDSLGVAQGEAFRVNSFTPETQLYPAVGINDSGDFVVAWEGPAVDGDSLDVLVQRYDSSGAAQGGELRVNSFTGGSQISAAVGVDEDGDFVVVWTSNGQDGSAGGIFGQRLSSSGAMLGGELQVNVVTAGDEIRPAIAVEHDGDFVVAWRAALVGEVRSRRFSSSGVGAEEIEVSTANAVTPAIGVDDAGSFVVAWWASAGIDGSSDGVFARRFNALGEAQAAEFQVNSYTAGPQRNPSVAMAGDGDFVVVWQSMHDGSSYGIFARAFFPTGASKGPEFQVNTYSSNQQVYPAVASDGGGNFVVAWQSNVQDGSGYGVFAQRFSRLAVLDVDGNGVFDALTDALLILRYGFGFSGAVLVTGVVGAGCTRCDSAAIEAYLQSID